MKKWSVMVRRPSEIAEPGVDVDYYVALVAANCMREAEEMAQKEAFESDKRDMGAAWVDGICVVDYRVLAVFDGHVKLIGLGGF